MLLSPGMVPNKLMKIFHFTKTEGTPVHTVVALKALKLIEEKRGIIGMRGVLTRPVNHVPVNRSQTSCIAEKLFVPAKSCPHF